MIRQSTTLGMAVAIALVALAAPSATAAGSRDDFRGSDLTAHYVRLAGFGGDSEAKRKLLEEDYAACVSLNTDLGKPVTALPPGGLPAVPQPEEVEIYYSKDATLTIKKGSLFTIRKDNCALHELVHHVREIRTNAGRCDIDMIKKTVRGQCAQPGSNAHPATATPDLSKVAPALREKVSALLAQQQSTQPVNPGKPAGYKTIANQQCELFQHAALGYELCIARPKSSFRIPAAPLNSGIPGVLMEAKNPALTLVVQEVALEVTLGRALFAIPDTIKVPPEPGARHAR